MTPPRRSPLINWNGGANSDCIGCGGQPEIGRDMCNPCLLLFQPITGINSCSIVNPQFSKTVRDLLGDTSTTKKIWGSIADLNCASVRGDYDWAVRVSRPNTDGKWITSPPEEWTLDEDDIQLITDVNRGQWIEYNDSAHSSLPIEKRRRLRKLQRGGILPDGSHLSWSNGRWSLDGREVKVPFKSLLQLIQKNPFGIDLGLLDFRKLITVLTLADVRISSMESFDPTRPDSTRWTETALITHPVERITSSRGRDTMRLHLIFKNGEFGEMPWMQRWVSEYGPISRYHNISDRGGKGGIKIPVSIIISPNGILHMRVRRNSGWRKMKIPAHPLLWSRLATWALSPPKHEDRKRLVCIQQQIFADTNFPLLPEDEIRGISFLRGIVGNNGRIRMVPPKKDGKKGRIEVTGTSGLRYSVSSGRGESGTRFVVKSLVDEHRGTNRRRMPWHFGRRDRICIVETPAMKSLSLGDAFGGVVLTLLDDENSRKLIPPLDAHMNMQSERMEVSEEGNYHGRLADDVRRIYGMLNRNEMATAENRCRRSFPMLWGALLRMSLGERITFTAMQRDGTPNITFDDAETQFRTTSAVDRRIVYEMLQSSGWQRDIEEERLRGRRIGRIYIKLGTGAMDLTEATVRIAGILTEGMVHDFGQNAYDDLFGQEPIEDLFEQTNPGPTALLPRTDCLID